MLAKICYLLSIIDTLKPGIIILSLDMGSTYMYVHGCTLCKNDMIHMTGYNGLSNDTKYVSFQYYSGLVPLHNACSYGHFEVTEMLLKVGKNI